jgi:hypothetical protein
MWNAISWAGAARLDQLAMQRVLSCLALRPRIGGIDADRGLQRAIHDEERLFGDCLDQIAPRIEADDDPIREGFLQGKEWMVRRCRPMREGLPRMVRADGCRGVLLQQRVPVAAENARQAPT